MPSSASQMNPKLLLYQTTNRSATDPSRGIGSIWRMTARLLSRGSEKGDAAITPFYRAATVMERYPAAEIEPLIQ